MLLELVFQQPEIHVMSLGVLQTPPTSIELDAMGSHPKESLLPVKQWLILHKEQPGYCCSSTGRTDNITWAAESLCVSRHKWVVPFQDLQIGGSGPWNTMYIEIGFHYSCSEMLVPSAAAYFWCCSFFCYPERAWRKKSNEEHHTILW